MAIVSWRSSKWHAVFDAGCPPYIYQIEINLRLDPHGNSWTSHSQRFRYPTPYDTSAALRIVSKGSSWQSCFPHLPCSHAPATRPECRLPSWSAPPKLLAVPLKRKAMNGKECTPRSRFDICKLRFKVARCVLFLRSLWSSNSVTWSFLGLHPLLCRDGHHGQTGSLRRRGRNDLVHIWSR